MQCCNIYDSYPSFQDGFKEMITLSLEEKVMQQKFKFLYFAIVAASCIFLVPTTSQAGKPFTSTHTPGETVGPSSRPPIPHKEYPRSSGAQSDCESRLVAASKGRRPGGSTYTRRLDDLGLGYVTRYIQSAGGYCYYYKGGTSSGASGPNTWRYDPR